MLFHTSSFFIVRSHTLRLPNLLLSTNSLLIQRPSHFLPSLHILQLLPLFAQPLNLSTNLPHNAMITGSKTSFFHFLGLLSGILLLSALIAPALADWCPAGGFVQCKITTVLSCPCSRPISLLAPSSERVNLFLHISIQNIKTESRPFIPLFFFVRTIIGLDSNTYETCGGRSMEPFALRFRSSNLHSVISLLSLTDGYPTHSLTALSSFSFVLFPPLHFFCLYVGTTCPGSKVRIHPSDNVFRTHPC